MKQCPKCNTLLGENASKCFNCQYIFDDNNLENTNIKKNSNSKKYICSKCSKPLKYSYDICECGGSATTFNLSEYYKNREIQDYQEDSSIGCLGWFICIFFSLFTFIICSILYIINAEQRAKLGKMIIISVTVNIIMFFINVIYNI